MRAMSIAYEETGRVDQKRRTRDALIDSARTLVADGLTPTVEDAAAAARISRTTAYRYFPNQRALLVTAFPQLDSISLLSSGMSDDPVARLDATVGGIIDFVVDGEPQLRAMLRLSLEATPEERAALVLRQGRAIGWLEDALSPLSDTVPAAEVRRLVLAIRATIGIESYVWLKDVAGLTTEDAVATMKWSAGALLRDVLAESKR